MKYLLDTHAWLWLLDAPDELPARLASRLRDMKNAPLGVSAISPWEVARKNAAGKLGLSRSINEWMRIATQGPGIEIVPLTPQIAIESNHLPGTFHPDPADRIIVATARIHGLILITRDRLIRGYSHVHTEWD